MLSPGIPTELTVPPLGDTADGWWPQSVAALKRADRDHAPAGGCGGSAAQAQGKAEDEEQGEQQAAHAGVIDDGEEVQAEGHASYRWGGEDEGEPGHLGGQQARPPVAHERDHLIGEKKALEGGFQGARTPLTPLRPARPGGPARHRCTRETRRVCQPRTRIDPSGGALPRTSDPTAASASPLRRRHPARGGRAPLSRSHHQGDEGWERP